MSPTFRSLSNRNYRLYASGAVVSNVGTWMQRVAQDWLVLQLTHNNGTALGITTGLQFLPMLLLSPYAGVIADRVPKRTLLQLTQLSMAVCAFMLGLLAVERRRRDAWLTRHLRELTAEERALLRAAAPVLERLSQS